MVMMVFGGDAVSRSRVRGKTAQRCTVELVAHGGLGVTAEEGGKKNGGW